MPWQIGGMCHVIWNNILVLLFVYLGPPGNVLFSICLWFGRPVI